MVFSVILRIYLYSVPNMRYKNLLKTAIIEMMIVITILIRTIIINNIIATRRKQKIDKNHKTKARQSKPWQPTWHGLQIGQHHSEMQHAQARGVKSGRVVEARVRYHQVPVLPEPQEALAQVPHGAWRGVATEKGLIVVGVGGFW